MQLAFKPALPLDTVVDALGSQAPGGIGAALKSAMDVKEILVRAPWGEIARAKLDGPLGVYRATLHVPGCSRRATPSSRWWRATRQATSAAARS